MTNKDFIATAKALGSAIYEGDAEAALGTARVWAESIAKAGGLANLIGR